MSVVFSFEDLYSGAETDVTTTLRNDGLAQAADITVDLVPERKYDLRIKSTAVGAEILHREKVFVTGQADDLEDYSETKDEYKYFSPRAADIVQTVVFKPRA